MSEEIELKPCPCCGGHAEMMGDEYPYVECTECSLSFIGNHQYDSDFESAAWQWNSRVSPEDDKLSMEVAAMRKALRLKEAECDALAKDAIEWFDVCDKEPPYGIPLIIKLKGTVQNDTWQFDASEHGQWLELNCNHLDDDIKEEFIITNKHIEGEILWARLPNN